MSCKDNAKRLKSGQRKTLSDVEFTNQFYGPVLAVSWKPDNKNEIIHLLSNHRSSHKVISCYKLRQRIETFFSDLETKGFHLQKSHISDLGRLSNLILAGCLAYIWLVLLGKYALNKGLNTIFHRTDRCDLSLFQLGFRFIEYLINNDLKIPKINLLEIA